MAYLLAVNLIVTKKDIIPVTGKTLAQNAENFPPLAEGQVRINSWHFVVFSMWLLDILNPTLCHFSPANHKTLR